ncbi:hypothetical protein [Aeromonas taiwanensis]|uniref:hypothetical protein n=1 Tax=Aeromonas taiwanensis TaxID=633417 RepID=UPI003B9FE75E
MSQNKSNGNIAANNELVDTESTYAHETPMVCAIDFDQEVLDILENNNFNYKTTSLHSRVVLNRLNRREDRCLLFPKQTLPDNLHEFDLILLDLTKNETNEYNNINHFVLSDTHHESYGLVCNFPQEIVNLKPYDIIRLNNQISHGASNKERVFIVFAGDILTEKYSHIKMENDGWSSTQTSSHHTLGFYDKSPHFSPKPGTKTKSTGNTKLSPLIAKFERKFSYKNIFKHPQIYDFESRENKNEDNFIPLILNQSDEIISYIHIIDNSTYIVFPDIENKAGFVKELLTNHLPEIFQDMFPFHGMFGWLSNGDYLLPNEEELLDRKNKLRMEYETNLKNIELELKLNSQRYNFLHDILNETGNKLVSAVKHYLEWLGFENVVNMDDEVDDTLEEDLQIENDKGLLIIEVKGIGGTSTDKACSQISKIKYRRSQQRKAFDVYALYIVNHQRYIAPKDRQNPPFSSNQINDANLDERGLISTYELYNGYFKVEQNILKKEDVREFLYQKGLIKLDPIDSMFIGEPARSDYYKNNTVVILTLPHNITIKIGDSLLAFKNDKYSKVKTLSLEVKSQKVEKASGEETGILFERKIEKGTRFFYQKQN